MGPAEVVVLEVIGSETIETVVLEVLVPLVVIDELVPLKSAAPTLMAAREPSTATSW